MSSTPDVRPRSTDVVVREAHATFDRVRLDPPFVISGRSLTSYTLAEVEVVVSDRAGRTATGRGHSVLSVPWAWPSATLDPNVRDAVMRSCVAAFASRAEGLGPADPIQIWRQLEAARTAVVAAVDGAGELPGLAAALALGAVDNAVHDAWSRAAGRPAFSMYHEEFLAEDLGWLDPALRGRYPGDFHGEPRRQLPVQHVVGVGDPLESGDRSTAGDPSRAGGEPSLRDWLRAEGIRHLKVKVGGLDPLEDAARIARVAAVAQSEVGEYTLAVDPNEGYPDAATTVLLAVELRRTAPWAAARLGYVEQPTPRALVPGRDAFSGVGVPVVIDEGYSDPGRLARLRADGWSGVVIKASKGQSSALVTHAYARAHDLFVTVQDLTCVAGAFAHSARLVTGLPLSSPHLEYNSRQYAPAGNRALGASHPALTRVAAGAVRHPLLDRPGLTQV
ncbi:enolase C-terminal domain-like protein [Occultella gossypii]|uniref:Enolase C-terminal domain-containing protein n=1 Tax=Occultella gossypii TaxID=2800820 RepID=A0ABS7SGR2_9MICO|nr:enolase C-terminal domain-like protein [Occultella gossypii]MBZ2199547.1 hypothetical protein [Occultella gossypii]